VDHKTMFEETAKWLDDVKMPYDPKARMGTMSIAQMQSVEIAKAVSLQANVVILDEPTSSLTDNEVEALFRIIRELKSRGVSLIYISHKMAEIREICDEITIMRDGTYVGSWSMDDISDEEIENIKEKFHIDVATGDPITHKAIVYKYRPILEDKYINLWAYNIETVLAEKLETVLTRGERNSRMKDYYDIYLIMKLKLDEINLEHLKEAVKNTFSKRNFTDNTLALFDDIKESNILEQKWKSYKRKKDINDISFCDTIKAIEKLLLICTDSSLQLV